MDDKTLILHLLNREEITYTSKLVYTIKDSWVTVEEATLNKWHPKRKVEDIYLKKFEKLKQLGIIELTSGNFENGERHYQIIHKDSRLKILKECVLRTTNTEFETIFKDILLKCERKLKLKKIENTTNR